MTREIRIRGVLIGKIMVISSSRWEVRDARGVLKGFYCPRLNVTYTPSGAYYASGEVLSSLL